MNVNIVAVRIDFFDSFILCFSNNNAVNKKVNEFCIDFFSKQFDRKYPRWVYDALKKAGVDVSFMSDDLRDDVNQDMKLYEDIND